MQMERMAIIFWSHHQRQLLRHKLFSNLEDAFTFATKSFRESKVFLCGWGGEEEKSIILRMLPLRIHTSILHHVTFFNKSQL